MKITCSSCGSKYTIADAKVQGKKVKVRCKSCKESILVDGTQLSGDSDDEDGDDAATTSAPTASRPTSPGPSASAGRDVWSVNLSDDDSREMTTEELVDGWKSGTVTSDAYVWKDGMGDWKPILEVGELKLKLGPAPNAGVVSSAGANLPGKPAANDLFGSLDAGSAGKTEARAKPAEAKPTGARNDSSVLFSLDSITAGGGAATSGSSSVAANLFGDLPTAPGGFATNNDLLMAPPKEPPPAPAGARGAAMALPAAQQNKAGKGMLIGGIVVAILVVFGAVFAMSGGDAEAEKAAAEAQAKAEEAAKAQAALEAEREKNEKMKADLEKAKKEAEAAEQEAKKAEEEAKKAAEEKKDEKPEEKAAEDRAATAPSGSSSSSSSSSSGSSSPSSSSGSAPFSVAAAKSALSAAAANAASCARPGGPRGSGKVQVTFSTSGRVTSANVVAGPFGGTPVGGCVASTFRRARVPAFSGSPQTVAKSFKIP